MNPDPTVHEAASPQRAPPRERILKAARDLFYRHGIRAVGVDAVAEAAGTNKMTLYRHFPSKDALICECLRQFGNTTDAFWDKLEADHPDPRTRPYAWVRAMAAEVARSHQRGCFLANAVVELAQKDHPARALVFAFKNAQRERLAALCRAAGIKQPELVAEQLFLVFEGAQVSVQSACPEDFEARLVRIGEAMIAPHQRGPSPPAPQPASSRR
jgi:AcrR family transcriptional regulator